MLEIVVDLPHLFHGDDPNYELWLVALMERVANTRRQQEQKAKKK